MDGEPVLARQASVLYRLAKKARKHIVFVSIVLLGVVTTSAFVAYTVRLRQQAAAEAQLVREMGESVKEMQLSMRNAYSLPLHDVERERDIVRQQIVAIKLKIAHTGPVSRGAGHYAMARGYLALQEPTNALEQLQAAQEAGYASPEFHYAYGQVLVALYSKQMEAVQRVGDKEKRAALEAEISEKYKTPALEHLRAAKGSQLEHPAYVEGLIALVEGRHEDALAKANEAFEAVPSLYEAKKLEGDVRYAMGTRSGGYPGLFSSPRAEEPYARAANAYQVAANIGRSDPDVHRAACKLGAYWMLSTADKHKHEKYTTAMAPCEAAMAASSRDTAARAQAAFLHTWAPEVSPKETKLQHDKALALAQAALQLDPYDVFSHSVIASGALLDVRSLRGVQPLRTSASPNQDGCCQSRRPQSLAKNAWFVAAGDFGFPGDPFYLFAE